MNQYQFEQVARRLEKKYGKIRKGEEERHEMLLFPMEGNLLKTHRKHPEANSRRLEEGLLLAPHDVEMRLTGERKDVGRFENRENLLLKKALQQAFDPFENRELGEILERTEGVDIRNAEGLEKYYKEPVICMLRIKESLELMLKKNGVDGYFDFIEGAIGNIIPDDEKMNYSAYVETSMYKK